MSTLQVRAQLHQYIDVLDDRFLQAMFAMVQQYVDNEDVVGSIGKQPLSKQQLIEQSKTAYQEYKTGKTYSQEAVALEIEKW